MTAPSNLQTIIPHCVHRQMKIVDSNGMASPDFANFLNLLIQALQGHLSPEGLKAPQQTTANITALNTAESKSAVLYDKDTHELKVNINGTFKTVQVA
jgi:hypothetical protein